MKYTVVSSWKTKQGDPFLDAPIVIRPMSYDELLDFLRSSLPRLFCTQQEINLNITITNYEIIF